MKLNIYKPILYLLLTFCMQLHSQIRLDDPLTVIKSPEGKTLTKADLEKLMKEGKQFSMRAVKKGDTTVYHLGYKSKAEIAEKNQRKLELKNNFIDKPLPEFSLNTINEETITNTSILGKVTVVNFWFIGCKPCIQEMPELNKLVDDYKGKVNFIAPSFNSKEQLEKFLAKKEFKYQTLYNSKSFNERLGVQSYPMHLIIDEKGILKEIVFGASSNIKERLKTSIEKLLNN